MRKLFVSMFLIIVGTICVVVAKDSPKSGGAGVDAKPPLPQPQPKNNDSEGEIVPARVAKLSPHQSVFKQVTDDLLNAYKKGDANAFASAFTADGEYIDAKGIVFHGRKAIEEEFVTFFRETPGTTIEMELKSTRSIANGVIAADGLTRFKKSATSPPVPGQCHLVCAREGDTWQIASLQEAEQISETPSHHSQVSQLEWMVGEWIGEGPRSHVHFSCRWDDSGHYLLRDFSVDTAGAKTISGTQRIGYDPITGHLKMWTFDSAGGYSDGFFNRDGNSWILRTSGVTSDGHMASTTAVFAQVDPHRMTSETIDRVIGGVRVADVEKLTVVRKPPNVPGRTDQADRRKD